MPSKPLEPGDPARLGRFELLGRLGEGGQGIVYLGRGTGPGEERVAVKVLRSSADALVLERLARELAAVHQVQPFVTARVIEATTDGDRRYVVSEFIDGPSLQERLDTKGPLAEGELLRLAVGTATALTAIHASGVVHRDFKPANVLLGPDGPRVVDFGIARLTDVTTITSGVIGTPSYIAPEQLAGERPTSAVDIWAWAATMIYAATGRMAFSADTVPARRAEESPRAVPALGAGWRKNQGDKLVEDADVDPYTEQGFQALVRAAIDELPLEFHAALEHVAVVVSNGGSERHAYGFYEGDTVAQDYFHDRIVIFRDTLLRDFGHDPEMLKAQVTRTVRHELAHHLGWGEQGVRGLGL